MLIVIANPILEIRKTEDFVKHFNAIQFDFVKHLNAIGAMRITLTARAPHLHLRIEEHKYSVIGKRFKEHHNQQPTNLHEQFTILKKCRGKFEYLVYEMLLIREKRPTLNTQSESKPAKLFTT